MTPHTEMDTISEICNRALKEHPSISRKLDLFMDIDYTHQATPLDLDQFLNFPAGDFNHDVFGIVANFNRTTLTMDNCFSPRYTMTPPA